MLRLRKIKQHVLDVRRPNAQSVDRKTASRSGAKPGRTRLPDARSSSDFSKTG